MKKIDGLENNEPNTTVRKINFVCQGKAYSLTFTKKSIIQMERLGFNPQTILDKPLTALPTLFGYSFIANHSSTSKKLIDDIYEQIDDKPNLLSALVDMYNSAFDEYMDEFEKPNALKWEQS
jgi:hypothetical protein